MTAETDLLPLVGTLRAMPEHVQGVVQSYARANVAHATAPLQAEIEALRAEVDRLRDALEEIRNRSSIGVMRSDQSDQSELEVVLGDICLFVDAVLWKEDRND